jgi:hypothetical protein
MAMLSADRVFAQAKTILQSTSSTREIEK